MVFAKLLCGAFKILKVASMTGFNDYVLVIQSYNEFSMHPMLA